jgi:hypothetical protein
MLDSFYHIACMGNWKEVVLEQKIVCDTVALKPQCTVLGTNQDLEWIIDTGLHVVYYSHNIKEYETPALKVLYTHCLSTTEDTPVLYFHTKGVSRPNDNIKKYWRWIMMDYVVKNWKQNISELSYHDGIGVSWYQKAKRPHFCGNFWISKSSWIKQLIDPVVHRNNGGPSHQNNPWARMHAEWWIGTGPNANMKSLLGHNRHLWNINFPYYTNYKKDK